MKKYLFFLVPFIIILSTGLILYLNFNPFKEQSDLPNCLRLHTGNVVAEVRYSNDFTSVSYAGDIYISRKGDLNKPEEESGAWIMRGEDYMPLEKIISVSMVDPGPKYTTSTLNGYDAVFSLYGSGNSVWYYYGIPIGNRNIKIDHYLSSSFSEIERLMAEKMLNSVRIKQTNKDVKEDWVEKCGK